MSALIVNLVGQPGAGKSTGAAYVFSKLKMLGINAELIMEYAKDKCWEESKAVFENQVYIFGKQYFRISRALNKVDVIVTDSPLILSCLYNCYDGTLGETFEKLVKEVVGSLNDITYFINRVKKYNPIGRFQNEEESDNKGKEIKDFLLNNQIPFFETDGDQTHYDKIVESVLLELATRKL